MTDSPSWAPLSALSASLATRLAPFTALLSAAVDESLSAALATSAKVVDVQGMLRDDHPSDMYLAPVGSLTLPGKTPMNLWAMELPDAPLADELDLAALVEGMMGGLAAMFARLTRGEQTLTYTKDPVAEAPFGRQLLMVVTALTPANQIQFYLAVDARIVTDLNQIAQFRFAESPDQLSAAPTSGATPADANAPVEAPVAEVSGNRQGSSSLAPYAFDEIRPEPTGMGGGLGGVDIGAIDLVVSVELGRAQMPIRKFRELVPGKVIALDKLAGEPVDVLVNGHLIARGEVYVAGDVFAVQLTSVVRPSSGEA